MSKKKKEWVLINKEHGQLEVSAYSLGADQIVNIFINDFDAYPHRHSGGRKCREYKIFPGYDFLQNKMFNVMQDLAAALDNVCLHNKKMGDADLTQRKALVARAETIIKQMVEWVD